MPKMRCRCGAVLAHGDIPSPIQWKLMSDVEFDKFSGLVDAEEVYLAMCSALRCPECGRFWVFWNGFAEEPEEFVPYRGEVDSLQR